MADIDILSPTGDAGTIPADQVQEAIKQGYTLPNAQTQKMDLAKEQTVPALTEGLARGITLGASDIWLTKDLGINPENIRARSAANPIASTTGQIAGNIATLGAGPALAPVAEGAMLGASNVATDYALGDPDLNAQKIISEIGFGAALGYGFGKLSHAISDVKVPEATGRLQTGLGKLQELMPEGFTRGLEGLPEKDLEAPIRQMTSHLQQVYDSSQEAVTKMYDDLGTKLERGLAEVPLQKAQENAFNIYSKIEAAAQQLKGEEFTPGASKAMSMKVSELQNDLLEAKNAQQVHSVLDTFVKDISGKSGLIKWGKIPSTSDVATQDLLKSLNTEIRANLSEPKLWGEQAAGSYKAVSDLYHELQSVKGNKGFDATFTRQSPNGRIVDPAKVSSYFKGFSNASTDIKKDILSQFLDISGRIAKTSENEAAFDTARDSIANRFTKLAKQNEEMNAVAEAMSRKTGQMHLPFGLEKLNPYNMGLALHNGMEGLKTAGSVLNTVGERISASAKSIFGASKASNVGVDTISKSKFKTITAQLKNLRDPNVLIDHMEKNIGPLHDSLPNIAPYLQASAQRGIQFLQSKIPEPMTQYALDDKWEASPDQIQKFASYYNTVNDPLSALKQIKQGTLSNETMETLHTVYPRLLDEMKAALAENMKPTANYTTKISLAKFMGEPLDSFQTPMSVMANQASMNTPVSQMQNRLQKTTLGGLKELNPAKQKATNVDRLAYDDTSE